MRPFLLAAVAMTVAAVAIAGSTLAAGGPPPGKGGGPGTEAAGNNLSVPAILVPTATGAPSLRLGCVAAQDPSGPQSTVFTGYWLQKTDATWTADCAVASTANVTADWGDNLTTAPSIAAGKPVRVEVGLLDPAATGMTGYVIDNLTPDLEDRLATYGTQGWTFATGDAGAPQTRVWDSGTHLTIEPMVDGTPGAAIYDGSMTAEINSMGAVVYGYNWGSQGRRNAPTAGTYRLTFTTSTATTIAGIADTAGLNVPTYGPHSTTLTVTLNGSTHGGGGR
jgi:hypothetical protein